MSVFAFKGGPVLTLDGKGRITVPARWRDVLVSAVQGQLMVSKSHVRCLSLFPRPVWDKARYDAHEAAVLEQDMSGQLDTLFIG